MRKDAGPCMSIGSWTVEEERDNLHGQLEVRRHVKSKGNGLLFGVGPSNEASQAVSASGNGEAKAPVQGLELVWSL